MKRRSFLKGLSLTSLAAIPTLATTKTPEPKDIKSEFLKVPEDWEDLGTISFRRKGDKVEALMYGDFKGWPQWKGGLHTYVDEKDHKETWKRLNSLTERLLHVATGHNGWGLSK